MKILKEHSELLETLMHDQDFHEQIKKMAHLCHDALKNDHKILFCGNGGSAADAQHIAAELSGKFNRNRDPLFAEALHVNTSYLTAVANDYGFEFAYSRLIQAKARKGDVFIGLSTSGNSENVINAFVQAKKQKVHTIAWTGQSGGKLNDLCDMLFKIPSENTPRIQEMHILLGHILCELVESEMFGD